MMLVALICLAAAGTVCAGLGIYELFGFILDDSPDEENESDDSILPGEPLKPHRSTDSDRRVPYNPPATRMVTGRVNTQTPTMPEISS